MVHARCRFGSFEVQSCLEAGAIDPRNSRLAVVQRHRTKQAFSGPQCFTTAGGAGVLLRDSEPLTMLWPWVVDPSIFVVQRAGACGAVRSGRAERMSYGHAG